MFLCGLAAVFLGQFHGWSTGLEKVETEARDLVRRDYPAISPLFAEWDRCNKGEVVDADLQPVYTTDECDSLATNAASRFGLQEHEVRAAFKAQAIAVEIAQQRAEPPHWPFSVMFPGMLRLTLWIASL